ncbi:pyruvate kinase alpha/beta domain-containing protein [Pseudomonas aeruginosa]
MTESGFTPLIMSRIRSLVPIYVYAPHRETQARVAMFAAWKPSLRTRRALLAEKVSQAAVDELLKRGVVTKGDWVILTKGEQLHRPGRHQHHEGAARRRLRGIRRSVAADNARGVIRPTDRRSRWPNVCRANEMDSSLLRRQAPD